MYDKTKPSGLIMNITVRYVHVQVYVGLPIFKSLNSLYEHLGL